jgi:hypothetical protein
VLYCKWHNSFSHAINDCNICRRQVQSTINEGRLKFQKIQVDTEPFPMNMINFDEKKVLIMCPIRAKSKRLSSMTHERPREADDITKISVVRD